MGGPLRPRNGLAVRENVWAPKPKEVLIVKIEEMLLIEKSDERLAALYEAYGDLTVKELVTGTSNLALPTMVQAKAILEMDNWIDARELAMRVAVPKGAGKAIHTQVITMPTYEDWAEGSALTAADPTMADKTCTLAPFGKVTLISDLLQNTSAYNMVEAVGTIHGGCVMQGILDKIVDGMVGVTGTNEVALGTKADSTEASFTLANVATAIAANMEDSWRSNFILTSAEKLWYAFTTNYAVTQFTGALGDLLLRGEIPRALGLEWYMDPYYELAAGSAFSGADGETYAIVGTKGISAIWAALQDVPEVAIERLATGLSNYVVTHIDGGADEGPVESICEIMHAE